MNQFNSQDNRFGSAAFATEQDLRRASMFTKRPNSLLVGFHDKRALYYSGAGGLLLTAGARGGKLRDILAYNLCSGTHALSMLVLDLKGELAVISQDQTLDEKFCIYWNPAGLHGMPQNRINPTDYIHIDSPSLVSDVKVFCENMIANSGSENSQYFEGRGREFLEAIILTEVRLSGVLTLPRLYEIINLIPGNTEGWLNFAFEMNQSGFAISSRIEEEIANSRGESSNGFQGILGEIFRAVSCLSDPTLLASVSPPYDFSFKDMCDTARKYHVHLMPPAEFVSSWSPVIKAMFVAGMIYKARAPQAQQQTWVLDECAQLGAFPMVEKLFTYGAGIGIRPWAIFQSTYQMERLGKNAANIITSSAQLRSYFAVRDIQTATATSQMLGVQTLRYDDEMVQARARHAKHQALQTILSGGDPLMAGMSVAHHRQEAELQTKQQRWLRTPDEILNMPADEQFIFCDDLEHAVLAKRKPYYEQRLMSGLYHPNPYHPPLDRVRVKSMTGFKWRPVITEPVSAHYRDYPQYKDGVRSKIGR
jgi:type IV secretion system protein VirD4